MREHFLRVMTFPILFGRMLIVLSLVPLFGVRSANATNYYSVLDPQSQETIDCAISNNQVEPGALASGGRSFKYLKSAIEQLQRKIAKKPVNIVKLKVTLKKAQRDYKRKKALCVKSAPAFPTPTPTPTSSGARPTATPTPTAGGCSVPCYSSLRNTTCFNIPSSTVGNETSGQRIWASCSGCHSESSRRNRRYDQISQALQTIPEMIPFAQSYSSKDIADIAAYLNRYNAKQCKTDWP